MSFLQNNIFSNRKLLKIPNMYVSDSFLGQIKRVKICKDDLDIITLLHSQSNLGVDFAKCMGNNDEGKSEHKTMVNINDGNSFGKQINNAKVGRKAKISARLKKNFAGNMADTSYRSIHSENKTNEQNVDEGNMKDGKKLDVINERGIKKNDDGKLGKTSFFEKFVNEKIDASEKNLKKEKEFLDERYSEKDFYDFNTHRTKVKLASNEQIPNFQKNVFKGCKLFIIPNFYLFQYNTTQFFRLSKNEKGKLQHTAHIQRRLTNHLTRLIAVFHNLSHNYKKHIFQQ